MMAGHVARIGAIINAYNILIGNLKRRQSVRDLGMMFYLFRPIYGLFNDAVSS
jgi:hypothetical protein